MIITPHLVYLHLHKSGGTFVNELLMRFVPGARQTGYHLPRSLVPPEYRHLPAVGTVRNPWSYYVSWYAFQSRREQPNALFRIASRGRTLGFGPTITNLLELGGSGDCLPEVLAAFPPRYTNRGLNLPSFALAPIAGSGLGFYGFLYKHMYEAPGLLHVARMERIRTDLLPLLVAVGQPVTAAMREFVGTAPARNASAHGDYASYYDAALRDLVARRDARVIEQHAYRFGD